MFASTCVGGVIFGELLLHCIPPPIHGLEKAKEACDKEVSHIFTNFVHPVKGAFH